MTSTDSARPTHWKWLVCGLLLFASMLLYMDRQTLPNVATRVTTEFKLKQEQYGDVEMYFVVPEKLDSASGHGWN